MITVGGFEVDGHFQVSHRRVGFTGQAIESGESIVDVVEFRSQLARLLQAFTRFIPTAEIHHGDTTLIVFLGGSGILLGGRLHALFRNADVSASAVSKLFAGTLQNPLQFLFGTLEFLLMEEGHGLFVEFHLCLDAWVHHFNAAPLLGVFR